VDDDNNLDIFQMTTWGIDLANKNFLIEKC